MAYRYYSGLGTEGLYTVTRSGSGEMAPKGEFKCSKGHTHTYERAAKLCGGIKIQK